VLPRALQLFTAITPFSKPNAGLRLATFLVAGLIRIAENHYLTL
jgi:hypothetical protein